MRCYPPRPQPPLLGAVRCSLLDELFLEHFRNINDDQSYSRVVFSIVFRRRYAIGDGKTLIFWHGIPKKDVTKTFITARY